MSSAGTELPWTEKQALSTDGLSCLHGHSVNINAGAMAAVDSGFVIYKKSMSLSLLYNGRRFQMTQTNAL